ncbi:MAG TPA: phosphoribosylglycinamide formyltransferase [Steroidobacteraceae bacterium]|jgi:phosphoribosylglycinamide formyltransferase-1|nr:phosphoribosylglycinamide formyltransferase [Steroidobacteraceae bacterium]
MSAGQKLRLAILISGRGSNMEAIARACHEQRIAAQVMRVIADRADAAGLENASQFGIATAAIARAGYDSREAHEHAVATEIDAAGAELVILAGYMRILSATFVERYQGRLLNIHPSLLPLHKGLHTHRRALEAGDREHGASVHFVSAELDDGPVICQARVPVIAGDSEDSLAARVLAQEHVIYPMAIDLIASGRVRWRDRQVWLDGEPLRQPLEAGRR